MAGVLVAVLGSTFAGDDEGSPAWVGVTFGISLGVSFVARFAAFRGLRRNTKARQL